MAAPQQHALTNTCTFPKSPAAFSPAGSFGSGQSAFCGDLHGRVSVTNDRDVPSVVCPSAAAVPQTILAHSTSRKTKPCSLCGTAALRSQSSVVPNSPISPQEQPVVLLHRLEDGLPEGDVDSLRAFGTIRLLPVHRQCGKVEAVTDDSKHECDRKYQSVASHTMAPGNLAYKSFKRENIKKRTEIPSGSGSYGDLSKSLTTEILRKYKASNDPRREKLSEKKVRSNTCAAKSEVDSSGISHRAKKRTEALVCDNSVGSRLDPGEESLGACFGTVISQNNYSQYSTDSLGFSSASQSSYSVSSPQHRTLSSSQAETFNSSATGRSSLSSFNNLSSPLTNTSSTTNIHSYGSAFQSCSTQDTIYQRSLSPDTPMSVVCSPVGPLTNTAFSSPSLNLGSPSAISPPESPPSPPSPFSLPFMCENPHSSHSVDVQSSSSPYSPCTLPSLPASPTSLPSSSESPPSPAPSIDSPPVSPSSGQQSEISDQQAPQPCSETLGDPHANITNTILESKVKPERSKIRGSKAVPQCHLNRASSMENDEELSSNRSYIGQKEDTQVPSVSQTIRAPSSQIHIQEDTSTTSQNSETKAQADSCQETLVDRECGDGEESVAEVEHLKPDFAKCFLNSESKGVEVEKNCSDSKNSLMKLVLKVKHPANQQLPLESEKKEYNKENGIPKIVLTLRGNGPNKEYSCSNRLRNESESCSGETVNSKKHKSKRNKRQKPKDRGKTKKVMKGGKHKRHVELFGEDSNDSCDIIPDNFKDHPSGGRHSKTTSIGKQELRLSQAPSTTEECPSVHGERDLPPTHSPNEELPSHCAKEEEGRETMDSPSCPVEESSSHSLPSLKSDASEINTVFGGKTKDRSLVEESEEVTEDQTKSSENNTHEAFKLTVEVSKIRDDEPPCSELKQEETSRASPGSVLHCSEISHQDKLPEGLVLRSRRSRHAKSTESGRNSDTCLWVSFDVNAPPLPATNLPSLEPVFTCKEKTRMKEESEANENIEHASLSKPPVGFAEKPVPKAAQKEWKERGKTEAVPDIKESIERNYEEKNTLLSTDYSDCNTDPSYSRYKVDSSSSHEDSNVAHAKIQSHGNPSHHRARHSHEKSHQFDDSQEEVAKIEVDSCQHNPLDVIERDENQSQEMSADSYQEKSATSDSTTVYAPDEGEMEAEEKSGAQEPPAFPDVSLRVDDYIGGHKDTFDGISQPEENIPGKVTVEPERPVNLKIEEAPDNQYYRPKKIRRVCNSSMTTDNWNEKKSLDQPEDLKAQSPGTVVESSNSHKDCVSLKSSSPETVTTTSSSGMQAAESKSYRVEWYTSEVEHCKPHDNLMRRDVQPKSPQESETSKEQRKRKYRSPTPQEQERVTRVAEEDEQSCRYAAEGVKEEATGKQEAIGNDCLPGSEDNEKQEISKKEKEKRKRSRREKRKDNSGPGSRCSIAQEAQFRREVEHEEGRGRRLAQEIKGFNWLEQKIKNSSFLSSSPAPSKPTAKEFEPTSRTFSTPIATPSTQSIFGNKEREHARKNSFSGSSSGIGFKRHLQTAVPPLVPSSKVTALPKRRSSLCTPTTPPCSASSVLCSVTSVPSMTVQGALYTCEPTHDRSGYGRGGPTLEKSNTSFEQEHAQADKATLYSSTSSTKATLYGVKDNSFEAVYNTVGARAVNYYGSANSGNIDTQNNIATSPAICFYGSAKYQEPGLCPGRTSSTGSHTNSSIVSTSHDSNVSTDHQLDTSYSPKPDICSSRNSDWSTRQGSSPNNNNSGYSADCHNPQRFSHKQTLLRRAFQEMMESEPSNSSKEQTKEKQCVTQNISTKTEINKADESKCKEPEAECLTTGQSSPERTSPVHISSLKPQCPHSTPPLLSSKSSSETIDTCTFSFSQKSVDASMKSEKNLIDPAYTGSKILVLSTGMSEDVESVTCKLNSNDKIVKSESDPNSNENDSDLETSLHKVIDNKNVKVTENSKDLQSDVIDCIVSASADIDMNVLKDEICYKGDGKNKEDAEVQPSLLSVLYKELMKTRQEVEKLRKVQELMLTEKGEKKDDTTEQNSEIKVECEETNENSLNNERILEKRKNDEVSDTELKIDYDECHYPESKRSKISIRSDLLPTEDSIALAITSSDTSTSQKNISHAHQSSLPALTNPSVVQSNLEISVTTLEGSTVPATSHPSRISLAIPAVSPGLSSSISVPVLPRRHSVISPGVSSPGVSRTSPGIPTPSPTITRASPGTPNSNSRSPGASISPAIRSSSPGIPRNSPGPSRGSPGILRMSPGIIRKNSGIPRASPGLPMLSPGLPMLSPGSSRNGLGLMRNGSEVPVISSAMPQISPTSTQGNIYNPPTNLLTTENLQRSYNHSVVTTVQPKMTAVQSVTSPVVPMPSFPENPVTSTPIPIISPTGGRTHCLVSRISPSISKIVTAPTVSLDNTSTALTNMSPTRLRSVFGISNSEVELMPVTIGAKQPLHEPQPQTFLNLVEDHHHHQTTETPLLLNAVQGVHQESASKNVELSSSHGPMSFHNPGCHEDPKRISRIHQYVGEMKRHALSTSDLPDHASSACKQPPPLKPVSTVVRRHSDNIDSHSVVHHQAAYPATRKSLTGSLHSSTSAAELKNVNSVHPFNQPQYSPTHYPLPNPSRRRSTENNASERNQGYQQAVSMGMQHHFPHLTPGSSVMRSLGPDKATIFPIPPTMPTGIRPFRTTTPPSVTRAQLEQFQNENFYRSNFSFFEKIREKFAHTCDNGVNAMDRLQSSGNMEKPLQPQTFVPRVLVRESMPEASSLIPTTTFAAVHFQNQTQLPPNAVPNHQNHFSTNMHSASSIHHMAQARLHASTNQAPSNIQHNSSSGRSGEKLCFHCPQQARFICSGCKKAWYCSEQCQREHWSIHSAACVL